MYSHILVPLDGSARSELIFEILSGFLTQTDARVTVAGVIEFHRSPRTAFEEVIDTARLKIGEYLDSVVRRLNDVGIQADKAVLEGSPDRALLDFAVDDNVDLVSMASHGYGGLQRLLVGSVTERIIRGTPVPILTVHSHRGTDGPADPYRPLEIQPSRIGQILVPLDGSKRAESVIADVAEFAKAHDAGIHLFRAAHVLPSGGFYPTAIPVPSDMDEELEYLEKVADGLRTLDLSVITRVEPGPPADAILDYVKEHPIDMIAMTTHGRSGVSRWLLGSVSETLLRNLEIPLLLRPTEKS